jgi:hypothetical protein
MASTRHDLIGFEQIERPEPDLPAARRLLPLPPLRSPPRDGACRVVWQCRLTFNRLRYVPQPQRFGDVVECRDGGGAEVHAGRGIRQGPWSRRRGTVTSGGASVMTRSRARGGVGRIPLGVAFLGSGGAIALLDLLRARKQAKKSWQRPSRPTPTPPTRSSAAGSS